MLRQATASTRTTSPASSPPGLSSANSAAAATRPSAPSVYTQRRGIRRIRNGMNRLPIEAGDADAGEHQADRAAALQRGIGLQRDHGDQDRAREQFDREQQGEGADAGTRHGLQPDRVTDVDRHAWKVQRALGASAP